MPELFATSIKMTRAERDRLGEIAKRTGCPRSRVLRVALGEVDEMPVEELRNRIAVLPDNAAFRSSVKRQASTDGSAATEAMA